MRQEHAESNAYLVVTRGLLDHPSGNAARDGADLVRGCLDPLASLTDPDDYPPRLLVLLATMGFQPFEDLLAGISQELRRSRSAVPLVGCSVAGVLTEERAMPQGAALVCLSSRFITAHLGVAQDALNHHQEAAASLLGQLGLDTEDLNLHGNRFLLCFLPGFTETGEGARYEAAEICLAIRNATRGQIPMVGGVAGDDLKCIDSWQFANDAVYTQSVVAALVESDVSFGIGMAHGLEGTGQYVYVKEIADNGHRIKSFATPAGASLETKTPREVIDACHPGNMTLFGVASPEDEGEQVVLYPRLQPDGSALVGRRVKEHWPLELLSCTPEGLHATTPEMIRRALRRGNIDPFHLACVIGFPCVARSKYATEMNLDVPTALRVIRESYPNVPMVAGLVFGEIGVGSLGRPAFGSWTISGLLLGDEITPPSLSRLGYRALADVNKTSLAKGGLAAALAAAESIEDVLSAAIDAVTEVGFPGSMISLVYHDRRSYVIVAQKAHSARWNGVIPLTVRRAAEGDILDVVGKSGKPAFIPDSRGDGRNDPRAVNVSGVISQYILPLIGTGGVLIGLLQIDLGDMSNQQQLPEYLETFLQASASQIAVALSRAIRIHELALSDLFDRAVAASLTKRTVAEAAQEFVDVVVGGKDLLKTDMIHIRLASADRRSLELVAGSGAYYTAAREARPAISLDQDGPTARAFRDAEPMWVNNVEDDVPSQEFISGFSGNPVGQALQSQRSYVNLMIRARDEDPPIGTINIAAKIPWFFSESLWRSLQTLGHRLFLALERAKEVEAERQTAREREFLLKMTPPLSGQNLRTSLREHAQGIATAANADVVSFYLWDPERQLLVLRGQHGWKKNMIGKAVYERGRGMTGTVAEYQQPTHIPDLEAWKQDHGMGGAKAKYEKEMFGVRSATPYEVIAIPLHFRGLLGVLTMHNALPRRDAPSRFATTRVEALTEVAHDISAFVSATQAHEETSYRVDRGGRIEDFGRFLLQRPGDVLQLARQVSSRLKTAYSVRAAAIYLASEDSSVLRLIGDAGLSRTAEKRADLWEMPVAGTALGNVFQHREEFAARCDGKGSTEEMLEPLGRLLPSGRMRSFLAIPLRDDLRDPLGVLVLWNIRNRPGQEYPWFTLRDISEFKRLAPCIARAIERRRLESEQIEAANELRESEHRVLYGSAIVGHLTHQLRNRMTEILSDVRTLVDEPHAAAQRERLLRVEGISGQLAERVNEYLEAMARGGATEHGHVGLGHVLERALSRSQDKARRRKVSIACGPVPDATIHGVEMDLEEAFFNVVDNGLDAMEPGGTLTISVCLKPAEAQACITITDTGKGMSNEQAARVFNGFFTSRRKKRPAMGLFLTKYVIGQHRGTVQVASKRNEGTTVTVTLPVSVRGRLTNDR